MTGQVPITQHLSRHKVRWLGHSTRVPETTMLYADFIRGAAGLSVGRPFYTWMDRAMHDLNTLGPRLQVDLLLDWPKFAPDQDLWRGGASRC